jgi:hypothetical protein
MSRRAHRKNRAADRINRTTQPDGALVIEKNRDGGDRKARREAARELRAERFARIHLNDNTMAMEAAR